MRLFHRRWLTVQEGRGHDAGREPLTDRWADRIFGMDLGDAARAIREARESRDPAALPSLISVALRRHFGHEEAIDAIPEIIAANPLEPRIIGMAGWLETQLSPDEPTEELFILSAICQANPGMFSGMVPLLLEMLESFADRREISALSEVVIMLGSIGDRSALGSLEALRGRPLGEELADSLDRSLASLRASAHYIN